MHVFFRTSPKHYRCGENAMVTELISPTRVSIPGDKPTAVDLSNYQVLVIVPAYNEERFIGSVLLKLQKHPIDVLVIDDGSTDNTGEIAQQAGVKVHRLKENRGKGAALNEGFKCARLLQPDVVVVIDADGQHLPEELPKLVEPILNCQADICVGSRYIDNSSKIPPERRMGHRLINLATKISSNIPVSDSQSGYRAFSPRALDLIHFKSCDFSVESEMQFLAREHNLCIAEVPITVRYMDKAKRSAVKQGVIVLNGILRLVGQYRPLLFFTVSSLLFLITGILFGRHVAQSFKTTQELNIGVVMIALSFSNLGFLMFSIGISLHSIRGILLDLHKK
jgi:glycosyltransferase involved in cell wall biosynthesis